MLALWMRSKARSGSLYPKTRILSSRFTGQYEESLIKLSNAESEIESLKLQIDDALGAEDLLVQLTERNLELGEVGLSS